MIYYTKTQNIINPIKVCNIQNVAEQKGLRLCHVELRFSSCACVYSQEKIILFIDIVEYSL